MSKLVRNSLFNFGGQLTLMLLGFAAIGSIYHRLGLRGEAVGILLFALTVGGLLVALLDLGVPITIARQVSAHWEQEPAEVAKVVRAANLLAWVAAALAAVFLYLIAPLLARHWLRFSQLDAATVTAVLRIVACSWMLLLPRSVLLAIFTGAQRMDVTNYVTVAATALQHSGLLLIALSGGSLLALAWWIAFCAAAALMAIMVVVAREFSPSLIAPGWFPATLRRHAGYALSIASAGVLAMISGQAGKIILSRVLGLSSVGAYSVAVSAASRGGILSQSLIQALFPHLARLHVRDRELLRLEFRRVEEIIVSATVPVYAGLVFFSRPLFALTLDDRFAAQLVLPMVLLAVGWYIAGAVNLVNALAEAVGLQMIFVWANALSIVVILPMAFVLASTFGMAGAALAWLLHQLFASGIAVPYVTRRSLDRSGVEWFTALTRSLVLGLLIYGGAEFLRRVSGAESLVAIIIAYAVATALFTFYSYRRMSAETRMALHRTWARIANQVQAF